MHLFYTPDINNEIYTLSEEESKHAVRVLRLGKGDAIRLIDGKGNLFEAEVADDHAKRCTIRVNDVLKEYGKRNFRIHIAMAPTKNMERTEWFLEKAVEFGLDEFTPLQCDHSERVTVKTERLHKIAVAAMKQSIKAYEPVLHETCPFSIFIKASESWKGSRFIAHCERDEKTPLLLKKSYTPNTDALILIGPEGDFSSEEIALALANGFQEISLGQSRLRTETAALAACHTIHLIND
ncbi:MAG TPA: 16S rRNA (uracil(1498)-N(3))-methyltransferase [Bacteroidia bacterium]|nr:16S rRNA (uracil(1498)-N(3))-methyltransferase [Bacteroidia bacterium]